MANLLTYDEFEEIMCRNQERPKSVDYAYGGRILLNHSFSLRDEENPNLDYNKWWAQDLSLNDFICLTKGISPSSRRLYGKLNQKDELQLNDKQRKYLSEMYFIDSYRKDVFPYEYILNELVVHQNDKLFLCNILYKNCISMADSFVEFIINHYSFELNNDLEKLKDLSIYENSSYSNDFLESLSTAEEALSVLLGLDSKYLSLFIALEERRCWNDGYKEFTCFEKWLHEYYCEFIQKSTLLQHFDGEILPPFFETILQLGGWDGSFRNYAQFLYDEGVIFQSEVYKKCNLTLTFSQASKVKRVYRFWCKLEGWSLKEAIYLLKGNTPCLNMMKSKSDDHRWGTKEEEQKKVFIRNLNVNSSKYEITMSDEWLLYEDITINEFYDYYDIDLQESLCLKTKLDIAVGMKKVERIIANVNGKEKELYKPKQLFLWILEHTVIIPPSPMVEFLLDEEEQKKYYEKLPQREKDFQEIPKLSSTPINYKTTKQWKTFLEGRDVIYHIYVDLRVFI